MPTEPDLSAFFLTPNALRKALADTPPTKHQNWALNRGGDVDVITLGGEEKRVVLRLNNVKKLTPEIRAELAEILKQSGVTVPGREAAPDEEPTPEEVPA